MKLATLLTSPPPACGWSIDAAMATVVRSQSKAELRCAAVEIPPGAFEVGPVGLQAVDAEKLRPVLNRLHNEVEGAKRAAVVVPTGWLRTHLLEFEHLPRRHADLQEMVLWRLKKLLPVAPTSLRLATVAQRGIDGNRRLLVLVGVERAIAELESVFESVGVSPGMLTPRVFAVAERDAAGEPVLLVQQEHGFLSIMLLVGDTPQIVRTKPLAADDPAVVERELGLTLRFIESSLEITSGLKVRHSAESTGISDWLAQWVASSDRLAPLATPPPALALTGTAIRDRVGSFRLDPVINVMSGRVR